MATPINQSVIKAFDVLDLFGEERVELTPDSVAGELGMSYATAHRFLVTLEAAGVLSTVRRGVFAPGPRLARLGRMAEELAPLPKALPATLDKVRHALGESVMACRFTPRGPMCVAVSQAQRPISVNIRIGTTLPMLNTAQGRLFLAHMSARDSASWAKAQGVKDAQIECVEPALVEARDKGFALNRGDNEPDIAAVSVPVLIGGKAVLTLSAFGMLSRMDDAFVEAAISELNRAAAALGG
ncbi:IclR family transcriptional regulator [Flavimaricola marinus]|uniref:p-hydroxybenzoate hydroxylase transcriptional activator n=1 Tax=Flavimaricola marinus TaxID=1819565 RepID=A0A238LGU8_9RHOB|nr:helix-turn-helix domain-containing protein [Flavimaricola marinus]SMY08848.1 p-hydroxybenzoate hydroxylase transcriptional activator [Flavimaricola marinus]